MMTKKKKGADTSDAVGGDAVAVQIEESSDSAGEKKTKTRRKSAKQVAKEEKESLQNSLLRLQADFDNFRKRTVRERAELYRCANEDLMQELLPVVDHLCLALTAAEEAGGDDPFVSGVKLVSDQLLTALGKFGMAPIETDNRQFDPNSHEAISYIPSPGHAEGAIIAETRKGYMLGGRVLRASQVVVASGEGSDELEAAVDDGEPADSVDSQGTKQ